MLYNLKPPLMKELRVLYITFSSKLYGDNKALLNIVDGIKHKGIKPFVIIASKGEICKELESRNIEYKIIQHYLSVYPLIHSYKDIINYFKGIIRLVWYNNLSIRKLTRIINEFNPDIIHSNVGPESLGYYIAKKFNIPHVWHIREYQDLDFGWHPFPSKKNIINKLRSSNNYPIAITQGIYNHYGMQKNARVIYDGVMKKNDHKFNIIKEKYFLFVGRLEESKGINIVIESYIQFYKYNTKYKLLIAGDGNNIYKSNLFKMIKDAGICNMVEFLGFRKDIYTLMENATAIIVASRFEGFGFITAEAMFNGCLVIGNNSGGTKEILEKNNNGILYNNPEELVTSMNNIVVKGIESYFTKIKKAQEQAIKEYSIEENINKVYELYKEIINNKK